MPTPLPTPQTFHKPHRRAEDASTKKETVQAAIAAVIAGYEDEHGVSGAPSLGCLGCLVGGHTLRPTPPCSPRCSSHALPLLMLPRLTTPACPSLSLSLRSAVQAIDAAEREIIDALFVDL